MRAASRIGAPSGIVALLLLLGMACGGDPDAADTEPGPAPEPPPESPVTVESFVPVGVSGELRLADGEIRFRECSAGEARVLEDGTEGEVRTIPERLESGDRPVGAHLVVDEGRLLEIRVVLPIEASGCPDVLPDAELQARGNEPFWGVDVTGERALFRTPEDPEGIEYAEGRWTAPESEGEPSTGEWRFEALRDFTDGIAYLTLRVAPERCFDTMSGAWYPFSARLSEGGVDYEGCALEGRRAHR